MSIGISSQPYSIEQDRYDGVTGAYLGSTYFRQNGAVYLQSSVTGDADGGSAVTYSEGTFFRRKSYFSFTDHYDAAGLLTQHVEANRSGSHNIEIDGHGVTALSLGQLPRVSNPAGTIEQKSRAGQYLHRFDPALDPRVPDLQGQGRGARQWSLQPQQRPFLVDREGALRVRSLQCQAPDLAACPEPQTGEPTEAERLEVLAIVRGGFHFVGGGKILIDHRAGSQHLVDALVAVVAPGPSVAEIALKLFGGGLGTGRDRSPARERKDESPSRTGFQHDGVENSAPPRRIDSRCLQALFQCAERIHKRHECEVD